MKKLIIIFIQLVFVYGINAQDNFFPLKVGNKFYYSVSSSPVPYIIVRIEKDTIAEGRKYFYCSGFPNYTDGWWRVDPITGSLYIFDPSNSAYPTYYKEKLIDSLRAGQGINVEIFGINSISKSFIISISIPFPQGRIEITKKYSSKFGLYNHSYHVLGSYNREHKLSAHVSNLQKSIKDNFNFISFVTSLGSNNEEVQYFEVLGRKFMLTFYILFNKL